MTAAAVPEPAASPITLIYIREPGAGDGPLDRHLQQIARRFPQVQLVVLDGTAVDAVVARRGPTPAVLVLRRGELVGECTGRLPAREIEDAVRCAVEWPEDL
jgi:hypothetical protein